MAALPLCSLLCLLLSPGVALPRSVSLTAVRSCSLRQRPLEAQLQRVAGHACMGSPRGSWSASGASCLCHWNLLPAADRPLPRGQCILNFRSVKLPLRMVIIAVISALLASVGVVVVSAYSIEPEKEFASNTGTGTAGTKRNTLRGQRQPHYHGSNISSRNACGRHTSPISGTQAA